MLCLLRFALAHTAQLLLGLQANNLLSNRKRLLKFGLFRTFSLICLFPPNTFSIKSISLNHGN